MSPRRQKSIPLCGRYRQVSLYMVYLSVLFQQKLEHMFIMCIYYIYEPFLYARLKNGTYHFLLTTLKRNMYCVYLLHGSTLNNGNELTCPKWYWNLDISERILWCYSCIKPYPFASFYFLLVWWRLHAVNIYNPGPKKTPTILMTLVRDTPLRCIKKHSNFIFPGVSSCILSHDNEI